MIDEIIEDKEEKKVYKDCIKSWVFRHECDKAFVSDQETELKKYLKGLISTGYATINDKIKYYSYINHAKAFYYRVIRRLRKVN